MKGEGYNVIKTLEFLQKQHVYMTYIFGAPKCCTHMCSSKENIRFITTQTKNRNVIITMTHNKNFIYIITCSNIFHARIDKQKSHIHHTRINNRYQAYTSIMYLSMKEE